LRNLNPRARATRDDIAMRHEIDDALLIALRTLPSAELNALISQLVAACGTDADRDELRRRIEVLREYVGVEESEAG
jgi:hypothetical protein